MAPQILEVVCWRIIFTVYNNLLQYSQGDSSGSTFINVEERVTSQKDSRGDCVALLDPSLTSNHNQHTYYSDILIGASLFHDANRLHAATWVAIGVLALIPDFRRIQCAQRVQTRVASDA